MWESWTLHSLKFFFIDENIGWVVGRYGTILKTIDGGDNWTFQESHTNELLLSAYFVDQDTGWVVGDRIILKTTNGGQDWTSQDCKTSDSFKSVYFVNADTGWVVGGWSAAIMLKTIDGGENWILENSGFADGLRSVHFINDSTGWIAGETGSIFTTVDAGECWIQQECHDIQSTLLSIYFTDVDSGWIVGENGSILSTVEHDGTGIEERDGFYPNRAMLMQNHPNPFNPTTMITFYLFKPAHVELNVYNLKGEKVQTLLQEYRQEGRYEIQWYAECFSSGIYIISLKADNFFESKKIILKK